MDMDTLTIGQLKLTWLNGGNNYLDGGAMFGVVPKPLWSKKYPYNDLNQIELRTDPILIQKGDVHLLVESGIGNDKLNDKQLRNFGVTEQSRVHDSLAELGLTAADIDYVLMTHLHFDHACGLSQWEGKELEPVFSNAKHIVSEIEWDEMRQPNIRSHNTYWPENWQPITDLVHPFAQETEIVQGIRMLHTGGHSAGHAVLLLESDGEKAIHFGDVMGTHAHRNPLWVMAYDDYPLDSVFFKQKWVPEVMEQEWWVTFYHDAFYRALKWDAEGRIVDQVRRLGSASS
jgi:glyoxylase-like metal-dependent hydrolase (beta-lactamase superfamily II)